MRQSLFCAGTVILLLTSGCMNTSLSAPTSPANAEAPPAALDTTFVSRFDADRAYSDLKKQVAFGARVPNRPAHDKCRDWLLGELKKSVPDAKLQDYVTTVRGVDLKMSNIVAHFNPKAKKQVMLCAHWDTRPTADMEITEAKRKMPIAGANDGASGVAVLLELARVFAAKKPEVGVQIVLFDGEDYGPGVEAMFLGAKHYAKNPTLGKPDYAILIDMIGDKNLHLQREPNSEDTSGDINDKVWMSAKMLGIAQFDNSRQTPIEDDHIPLIAEGWKAIDIIDFDYPSWHTLEDTPDKCSPESLKAVGDVLARVVYTEKP